MNAGGCVNFSLRKQVEIKIYLPENIYRPTYLTKYQLIFCKEHIHSYTKQNIFVFQIMPYGNFKYNHGDEHCIRLIYQPSLIAVCVLYR